MGFEWYNRRFARASKFFYWREDLKAPFFVSSAHLTWITPHSSPSWITRDCEVEVRSRLLDVLSHGIRVQHYLVDSKRFRPLIFCEATAVQIDLQNRTPVNLAPSLKDELTDTLSEHRALPWSAPRLELARKSALYPTRYQLSLLGNPTTVQVKEDHLDQWRHVAVKYYGVMVDHASKGVLKSCGLPHLLDNHSMENLYTSEAHCHWFAEITMGASISIYTRILDVVGNRVHLIHFFYNDTTDELCSLFEVVGTYLDENLKHTPALPGIVHKAFETLAASHNQLPWPSPIYGAL